MTLEGVGRALGARMAANAELVERLTAAFGGAATPQHLRMAVAPEGCCTVIDCPGARARALPRVRACRAVCARVARAPPEVACAVPGAQKYGAAPMHARTHASAARRPRCAPAGSKFPLLRCGENIYVLPGGWAGSGARVSQGSALRTVCALRVGTAHSARLPQRARAS